MGNLYQFEKTDMIQPDNVLFENYQTSKQDLQRINEKNKVDQMRVEILQDANERLNSEVQRLKKQLALKPSSQPSEAVILNERKQASAEITAMYAQKIALLEQQNKNYLAKIRQQSTTISKLEALLDEVYESESQSNAKINDIEEIKRLNQRMNALINKI